MLMETLIESYLNSGSVSKTRGGEGLKTAIYTVEFLGFIGNQLSDFPELYFRSLCGVNLDPILQQTIAVDEKNAHIVIAYAKFLDQLSQCLLQRHKAKGKKAEEAITNRTSTIQEELLQKDTARVMRAVEAQISNIIDGLDVYKNAFETVAGQLCSTALQIVHELILNESISDR